MESTRGEAKVVYVYDAYCGWCYGFSRIVRRLYDRYKLSADFTVLSGGMIIGQHVGPLSRDMAGYIKQTYRRVEELSGCEFGAAYLDLLDGSDMSHNSEVPSRALTAFKTFRPDRAVEFARDIQMAHFFDGRDLTDSGIYASLVRPYNIDADRHADLMASRGIRQETVGEFEHVRDVGVRGFPAVYVIQGGNNHLLTQGFTDFATIDSELARLLKLT